jgi:hypothetical protein
MARDIRHIPPGSLVEITNPIRQDGGTSVGAAAEADVQAVLESIRFQICVGDSASRGVPTPSVGMTRSLTQSM